MEHGGSRGPATSRVTGIGQQARHRGGTESSAISRPVAVVAAGRNVVRRLDPSSSVGRVGERRPSWRCLVHPSRHPPCIQVSLDHPCRGDEIAVARDRPRQPVHVGRLERRDLTQGVPSELAELGHDRGRIREVRASGGAAERPIAATMDRTIRVRRTERHRTRAVRRTWRLARWPRRPAGRRVSRADGLGRIEPTRDRAGPGWRWRSTRPPSIGLGRPVGPRGSAGVLPASVGPAPDDRLVRRVDLGHPPGRPTCGSRIAGREIGVMFPRETAPGRLDLCLARVRLEPEDGVRISGRHVGSLPA